MTLRRACMLALLLTLWGLAGCGQKGALYLPQPEEPVPTEEDSDSK